jgi:hypothetical protein
MLSNGNSFAVTETDIREPWIFRACAAVQTGK